MKKESYCATFIGGPVDGQTQKGAGCDCCEGIAETLVHFDHVARQVTGFYDRVRIGPPVAIDGETLTSVEYQWREKATDG